MNFYQQGFKQDILNTIFKLTGKTWLKITGGYAIQMVVTILLFLLVFGAGLFNKQDFLTKISSATSPQDILGIYEEMFNSILSSPMLILVMIVLVVALLVLFAWATNFQVLVAEEQIKNDHVDFSGILRKSVNKDIFRIFGAILVMYLAFSLLVSVVAFLASISGLLMFILLLAAITFILRFVLIVPSMVVGKRTFMESLSWTLKNVTWLRGIKILGIGFLAGFIILVAAGIVGLISTIFTFIPALGQVVQLAINIFVGGFISALMTSAFMGLYYRYEEEIPEKDPHDVDIDDLLISE